MDPCLSQEEGDTEHNRIVQNMKPSHRLQLPLWCPLQYTDINFPNCMPITSRKKTVNKTCQLPLKINIRNCNFFTWPKKTTTSAIENTAEFVAGETARSCALFCHKRNMYRIRNHEFHKTDKDHKIQSHCSWRTSILKVDIWM